MWYRNLILVGLAGVTAAGQVVIQGQRTGEPTSFLGVFLQEISGDRARALSLPEETGVEITRVDSNSPAANAGLMPGDVVLQYNGQRIEGIEQFSRMVRETPAGREVRLQIFRNGGSQTVTAKIGTRTAGQPPQLTIRPPALPRVTPFGGGPTLGIETESLSGQLADYFGVKEGVLVRSVAANSAAERAGIKAGDVITRVADAQVASATDIANQLHSLRGPSVSVSVMRDHREMAISVVLESGDGSRRF